MAMRWLPRPPTKKISDTCFVKHVYDFPAEHWQHLRTTNPIESTFATVRHRTTRTRNCVSRPTFLGLAFKLIESAEKSWRRIRAPEKVASLLEGVPFKDGLPVTDSTPAQQPLAARSDRTSQTPHLTLSHALTSCPRYQMEAAGICELSVADRPEICDLRW
jgi:hypothetical protein